MFSQSSSGTSVPQGPSATAVAAAAAATTVFLVVPRNSCQKARELLEEWTCLDQGTRFRTVGKLHIGIPVLVRQNGNPGDDDDDDDDSRSAEKIRSALEKELSLEVEVLSESSDERSSSSSSATKKRLHESSRDVIWRQCKKLMESQKLWLDEMSSDLPRSWEQHTDLILLPEASFKHGNWYADPHVSREVWLVVCHALQARRVAKKTAAIRDDDFRSPRVRLLHGFSGAEENADVNTREGKNAGPNVVAEAAGANDDAGAAEETSVASFAVGGDTWARRVENGVVYTWDITRSMFSAGNVTEKLRVAHELDCSDQTVVDLFAGIGYFALPYLVHARCRFLHACEWNPAAAEALRRNLRLNGVSETRYALHEGDNRLVCPEGVADRVNLGLIPSAEISYETACRALREDRGGVLHVHGNVDRGDAEPPSASSFLMENVTTLASYECKHPAWHRWGVHTAKKILNLATALCEKRGRGRRARVELARMTRIKSYGPKVDHLVLDLNCVFTHE